MNDFELKLALGRVAEGKISKWLVKKGHAVLPVYQIEGDDQKGPRLFMEGKGIVVPDLLVFHRQHGTIWVESKHKTVFTWYRKANNWQTGIDLYLYEQYIQVQEITKLPVWILFLHSEQKDRERPKDPWPCPIGLFGHRLDVLRETEDHRSTLWGKSGMVYWNQASLEMFAQRYELD